MIPSYAFIMQMVEDLPVIENPVCNSVYGIIYDGIMCIDSSDGKGVCNVSMKSVLMIVQLHYLRGTVVDL